MKKLRIYSILSIFLLFSLSAMAQKVVRYDLYVKDTSVNYSGKEKRAIAVNGMIPMPTLTFTEGDTAEIHVHNEMDEPTSMHWHGVYLPNPEDGVPFLTQIPIKAKSTYIYRFPIIQNGTHWYHSHTGMQEQIGMYGAMILKKREDDQDNRKGIDDLPSIPIILSEWTNLNPDNVHRMLHNANDWFAIKKNATQSYAEAIKEGHFKTKVTNEWKRMLAMDVSDVYYDRFLINGSSEQSLSDFKAGDKVRLRVINAGASSYFWLTYAGGKITVVANDGNDVEPVKVDRLLIAVSETYDIVVEIPEDGFAYEFMATPEDRTKNASIYLGSGVKQLVAPLPKLKYFEGMKMMNDMMKMNGDLDDMGMKMSMQRMDMNTVMYPEMEGKGMQHGDHQNMDHSATNKKDDKAHQEHQGMNHAEQKQDHSGHQNMAEHNQPDTTAAAHAQHQNSDIITLNYGMLRSPKSTKFPEGMPVRELKFELTGNMSRYVWSLDDKVLSEVDKIPIKKGEALRIILYNNSMMRHPMHLHGHDFRVLNGQGDYAPLKNVLDIMPMETDTIEFESNVHGDWFFHCHILYHMMAGMNRVFSTEGQPDNPKLPNKEKAYRMLQRESNMPHFMIQNDFATNGNDGELMLHNARWQLTSEWRLGYHDMHGYEVETHLGRFVDRMQWFMPFIGFDWRYRNLEDHGPETNIFGQTNSKHERALFSAGFVYTLPMLIRFQAELYHDGNVRLQLMREDIPLSKRLRGGFMVNSDKEYMADLRYIITRHMGIRTHYDSDMGFGVGLSLNY
ncbi:multicopper oxidase domain-containing protein [Sphingobacterium hotanense]|uniref:multicopper oxidase domain-containing protein n=1 Tax=Sphingobacterium hotanense TaxID=649196 RepID=UPI0011F3D210|nr:multicopper oxidase domain-containing protein [Sphingobacterium hotanense]